MDIEKIILGWWLGLMEDKYYKKYIEKLINDNPTTITIIREVKTDDGYGGSIITKEEVTEVVNFYDVKARREVVTDYGKTYTGVQVTKILAKGNADIQKDDIFTVDDIEYKVFHVNSYRGICKQIELEVIK